MSSWNMQLTRTQAWLLCCALLLLHVTPLLMADMPVLDDVARQYGAHNDWLMVGRPLMTVLNSLLAFSPAAVNLYPLPLLLALLVTAQALARLVTHWFTVPTLGAVLVVMPIWYQPFFLQNLSYQYDGAGMALSLACAMWATTLGCQQLKHWVGGVALITAGAALYQPAVSVVAALFGVEVMRQVMSGKSLWQVARYALVRLAQLLLGVLLYYLSCAGLVANPARARLLPFDAHWLGEMHQRVVEIGRMLDLFLTPWLQWLALALVLLALISLRREAAQLWSRPYSHAERLGLGAVLFGAIPVILLCIPGMLLFLAQFDYNPRTLMASGVALALLFYLVHAALAAFPRLRVVILVLALLPMLSLSFAYGRVLVLQKALHASITQNLAYDLSSQPTLAAAKHYYALGFWQDRLWVPAAAGTLKQLPVIEWLDPSWYLLLPEMLPNAGVDRAHAFYEKPPMTPQQVRDQSPVPRLRREFYDIHLIGDDAYVLIKLPPDTGAGKEYSRAELRSLRFGWDR